MSKTTMGGNIEAGLRLLLKSERPLYVGAARVGLEDLQRLEEQLETIQARLLTLTERTRDELAALERWAGEQNAGNAFADQVRQWAMAHRERLDAVSSPASRSDT